MAQETSPPAAAELSPLMKRAVLDDSRWTSPEALRALDEREIEVLRGLAVQRDPPAGVRQDKVITALVERAPDAATARTLGRLLDDASRPAVLRAVAAVGLGRIPVAAAEAALLAHVADPQAGVAQRAVQSLGYVGGTKALAQLEGMSPPADPSVRRQWEFSTRLVRHRLRRRGGPPARVEGTSWDAAGHGGARALPLERIEQSRLESALRDLRGRLPDVELAKDVGYGIGVDRSLQYLLLARPLSARDGILSLAEGPMVAAVVAMWEPRTGRAVLHHVVLTEPFDGAVLVQGFRLDGARTFEGFGSVGKDAARFAVVSVARDGQCRYRVTGELIRHGLTATGELQPRRSPRRTEPSGREAAVAGRDGPPFSAAGPAHGVVDGGVGSLE